MTLVCHDFSPTYAVNFYVEIIPEGARGEGGSFDAPAKGQAHICIKHWLFN